MTTSRELVAYYANLLIQQYVTKEKAFATIENWASRAVMPQTSVQTLTWSSAPASGTFTLGYGDEVTTSLNWNSSAANIQTALRALTGLDDVTVDGEISSLVVTVTFTGVPPPAELLTLASSTLNVEPEIAETDLTLPLAVQAGFNLIGGTTLGATAVGAQLDTLGKYAGVTRSGRGFTSQIVLDDSDFLSFILMAIIRNSSGSSLATIQAFLQQFFPDQVFVFDYQNMHMSYMISTEVGSYELVQLFVTEGLLPVPMAVAAGLTIYAPVIDSFFGFRTYEFPAFNSAPFNTYADFNTDYLWLSYQNAVIPP